MDPTTPPPNPPPPPPPLCCRFKVFADYEDYIKCQETVSALYRVSIIATLTLAP